MSLELSKVILVDRTPRSLSPLLKQAPMNPSRWDADVSTSSPTSCQSMFPLRTCDDRRYTQTALDLPETNRWGVSRYHSDSLVLVAPRKPLADDNLLSMPVLPLPHKLNEATEAAIKTDKPPIAPRMQPNTSEMQMTWKRSRSSIRRRVPARSASKRAQPVQEMDIIWEREIPFEKSPSTGSAGVKQTKSTDDDDDDDCDVEKGNVCNVTKNTTSSHTLETNALGAQFSKFFECPSTLLSLTDKTTWQILETAFFLICDSFPPKVEGSDAEEHANGFWFDVCGGEVAPTTRQLEYSYDLQVRT